MNLHEIESIEFIYDSHGQTFLRSMRNYGEKKSLGNF